MLARGATSVNAENAVGERPLETALRRGDAKIVDFAPRTRGARNRLSKPAMIYSANDDRICTSHVERLNLTARMTLRRFTRLTNAQSKSLKHHVAMQAILFAWNNFCRKHATLKGQTPAMAAGLAEKPWTNRELLQEAT
jgi:hypothetical protein